MQKNRSLFASTPGFKGNNYKGHEWVIDAIVDQLLEPVAETEKEKGLVNLWVDVPYQDEFWLRQSAGNRGSATGHWP
jgi:nitrogenase molybdenum-iron protein beta chain